MQLPEPVLPVGKEAGDFYWCQALTVVPQLLLPHPNLGCRITATSIYCTLTVTATVTLTTILTTGIVLTFL